MRHILILFLLFGAASHVPARELPWVAGETLTYEIHWGLFIAAEATFKADRNEQEDWTFRMQLHSRGVVDTLYPIDSAFTSTLTPQPWRSVGFQAKRNEGGKDKAYRVDISYPEKSGTFTNILEKANSDFDVPHDAVDDLLSMLYTLRRHPWDTARDCAFRVYEDRKVKEGKVVRIKKTKLKDDQGNERDCWLLEGREVGDIGDKRRVVSRIWLTADERRIPLRAECQARFGTFRMSLVDRK
jgi:hypothetical protein